MKFYEVFVIMYEVTLLKATVTLQRIEFCMTFDRIKNKSRQYSSSNH